MTTRLAALFLLAGGLALVIAGAWFGFDNARFLGATNRAEGVIEDVVGRRGARGHTFHHPVVRYRPRGHAQSVVFTARPGLWSFLYHARERVTVAYRPDDPEDAKIVSFWMLWFLPGLTLLFGVGCMLAGRHTLAKAV